MPTPRHSRRIIAAAALAALPVLSGTAQAVDASQPAILQMFEATYRTIERRAPDIFMAGYGGLWTPPPGRADQGNLSVGYDVYDRFDLGSAGNYTLYGSENGLKQTVVEMHKSSVNVYTDLVWNHNGYSDKNTAGFQAAGAYPGFVIQNGSDTWGDFHNYGDSGDVQGRLAGLIDIAQEKNHQYVRNPVPGFAANIPAGTTPFAGRLANVATEANRRFYSNQQGPSFTVSDPATGNTVTYYQYDTANPSTGDPVSENATGYLMRQARWMVEQIGVDGFRLDATKHVPTWVWNYYDQAVFRAGDRKYLDNSNKYVFSFGEALDSNTANVQNYIRKDITSANTVGGNRDALDFAMHYALKNNLSNNGTQNSWLNVVNTTQDVQDDGLANNGSQGVSFDASHDDGGAYLGNVASAYLLMRPGNSIVYMNAKEFGTGRAFPKDGRGDALGGFYGNTITKLVDIRNTHGRGNYQERWLDKETLVYERQKGLIAGYNNRVDNGYDQRTVNTFFDAGMHLVELTGNATNGTVDPNNDIFDTVVVQPNGQITIRIPRNKNPNGVQHDKGYVIYGPATPQGTLGFTNVARTIAGETGTAANNGTVRLTGFDVVSANNFEVQLQTNAVVLSDGYNDLDAAGDNAVLRFDGGININGNGGVDYTGPTSSAYGFEDFLTAESPKYGGGTGLYRQAIDATALSEGFHYVTARAYRHQAVAGTPLWTDFRKVVYVDRVRTTSSISDMVSIAGAPEDRDIIIKSDDKTANKASLFANVGSSQYTIDQLVSMAWSGQNAAGEYDRDLFKYGLFDMKNGNQAFTIVSFEPSFDPALGYAGGGVNVQRIVVPFSAGGGAGLGDLTWNGLYAGDDQIAFLTLLGGNANPLNPNTSYNPAGDLNADGTITEADNVLMVPWLTYKGAPATAITQATSNRLARALISGAAMDIPSGNVNVSGTLVPGQPLTFNSGFNITANKTLTKTGGEALNINGTQGHGVNSLFINAGGTTNFLSNAGGSNQNLTITTSGATSITNFAVTQRLKALNIDAGGTVNLNTATGALVNGGKVVKTQTLNITDGKLDLKNNNAVIDYTGDSVMGSWNGSEYTGVTGYVAAARNGGGWDGPSGIFSSSAATQGVLTMLVVGEAASALDLSGAQTTTWFGQTVDATSVLVKYTWGGDADLNGELNGDDYFAIDSHIVQSGSVFGYSNGDFDLNGELNGDDYFIIDSNYPFANASGTVMGAAGAGGGSGLASVPEPASLGMLLAAGTFASTRRRRHHLDSLPRTH